MKRNFIAFLLVILCCVAGFAANAPKYIFYFIGDGMGMGHIMSTQNYLTQKGITEPLLMTQFTNASICKTYSASSPITDSAAAGTALATGYKTNNGMLGMGPDTTNVYSIANALKAKGYGIGITTTVPIDDATPGAFYAHVKSRKEFTQIGIDLADSGFDFFAGSNLRGDADGKVSNQLRKRGYGVYYGLSELNAAQKNPKKILLLAPHNQDESIIQCGYTIDSIAGALTLPQMTETAIKHLTKYHKNKFFLMVEGGNIDWAAHANDGAAVIKEIVNFNESLKMAYDFYLAHPDETLIVVTADHDTGGMTIGCQHGPKKIDYTLIDNIRCSKERFSSFCKSKAESGITWEQMKSALAENFGLYAGISVDEKNDALLKESFEKVYVKKDATMNETIYNSFNNFVEDVFYVLDKRIGFGWTTTYHTGNPVPLFAIGVGSEEFMRMYNNIEIPQTMAKLTGVKMSK